MYLIPTEKCNFPKREVGLAIKNCWGMLALEKRVSKGFGTGQGWRRKRKKETRERHRVEVASTSRAEICMSWLGTYLRYKYVAYII